MPEAKPAASEKPFAAKLGVRAGHRVVVLDAPPGFLDSLRAGLPDGVTIERGLSSGPHDVIVFWVARSHEISDAFERLRARLKPDGALWAVIAKRWSAPPGAPTWEELQAAGLAAGLVDNKTLTFSERDYGTRFVFRLRDRPSR